MSFTEALFSPLAIFLFSIVAILSLLFGIFFLFRIFTYLSKKMQKLGFQLLMSLILIFFFLGALNYILSQNALCLTCHKKRVLSDAHSRLTCLSCHQERGISGSLVFKLEELKMFLNTLRKANSAKEICVPNSTCLRCHENIKEAVPKGKNIRVRHVDFINLYKCILCHQEKVHPQKEENRLTMEKCTYCHQKEVKAANCQYCHKHIVIARINVNSSFSKYHHDSNWKTIHGLADIENCYVCHDDSYCKSCHLSFPHNENWPAIHGKTYLDNKNECRKCHLTVFCNDCHGTPMPHTDEWKTLHGLRARHAWESLCTRCHSKLSCLKCHQERELEEKIGRSF